MSDLISWMAPWSGRVLVLGVFCLGALIALRGWVRWRRSTPACPKCGYDRSHSDSASCPECGHVSRSPTDTLRRPRRWRLVLIGLLVAISLPVYVAQRRIRGYGWDYYTYVGPVYWIDPYKTAESVTVHGVTIETEHDRVPWTRRDRLIVEDADGRRSIGVDLDEDMGYRRWSLMNEDGERMVGRWSPDSNVIAVMDYSGGAHCCFTYWFYEIRDGRATLVTKLHTGNSDMRFEDVDNDSIDEITLVDDAFAYWNTCFACSPMPKVIARWNGKSIVLADELMRNSMDQAKLDKCEQQLRTAWDGTSGMGDNGVPVIIWSRLLDLIYSGHADAGFDLLARVRWPEGSADRAEFEHQFLNQLAQCHWANDLARMNGGAFAQRIDQERAAIAAAASQ